MVSTVSRVSGEYCRLYWGRRGWGGGGSVDWSRGEWASSITCKEDEFLKNTWKWVVKCQPKLSLRMNRWKENKVSSSSAVTTKMQIWPLMNIPPIPVVARSMALVCGATLAGFADSNPAERMDVCVFCECCVSSSGSLSDAAKHSPRKVLLGVVCLCVIL